MLLSDEELLLELDRRFKECKKMLDEQKELSRELFMANKKLMESEALKTHFISSITNEIINPFSSVLGLSRNILLLKNGDLEKARNMARLIHSEAFCLDFQFRNIFAAAKIEAGELFVESAGADIADLVNSVVDAFSHEAGKKKISISVNYDLPVAEFNTDSEKLKLLISNLLSNAIKFNTEEGSVSIKISKSGNYLFFTIEDTGIGIIEKNLEVIYDRFVRIDDRINSLNMGHGLGLSIVKSFVELLNGKIEVNSIPGKGSRFELRIPESHDITSIYKVQDENDLITERNNEIF